MESEKSIVKICAHTSIVMAETMTSDIVLKTAKDNEVKEAFSLRYQAFVIDEGVKEEEEFDDLDSTATHIVALLSDKVVGCCRSYHENGFGKISRLVVEKSVRRQGISTKIVLYAERLLFLNSPRIVVHAHVYVSKLYTTLGYTIIGDQFMEDGSLVVKLQKEKI